MEHADHIEAYAKKLTWSELEVVTSETREQFYNGLDLVDGYRGDAKKLIEALNAFQQIPSKPFAMAGVAYVLVAAAYEQGRSYSKYGLGLAQKWMNLAYATEVDSPDIKIIQMVIDLNQETRHPKDWMPDGLEEVTAVMPDNYHIQYLWLDFKCRNRGQKEIFDHYESMLKQAKTPNEHMKAHSRMMSYFFYAIAMFKTLGEHTGTSHVGEMRPYVQKSEIVFERMKPFAEDDPWFWHNQTVLMVMSQRYWKAAKLNKKALSLMDFGAAHKARDQIKEKIGFLYRLA